MNDAIDRIAAAMPLVLTGVVVAAALLAIVLVVRVVRKAGYSPWWAVGVFVPGVNLVLLVMFATVRWPLERRLEEAEGRLARVAHLGGLTPYTAAAPTTSPVGPGAPRPESAPRGAGPSVPVRPSSGPESGSYPVHLAGAAPSGAQPVVTPPTFTALPYPAGYGPPPSPVSDGRSEPADSRPETGA
jgi:hypothetical protein